MLTSQRTNGDFLGRLLVAVITKDAEITIAAVLQSLAWATQVHIWDLGSTDNTVPISLEFQAVVHRWPGPVPPIVEEVRLQISQECCSEYILFVDQDEIHINTEGSIRSHIESSQPSPMAFDFVAFAFGHSMGYEGTHCRLFRSQFLHLSTNIHQGFTSEFPVIIASDGFIEHHAITGVRQWYNKWRRYCNYEATTLSQEPWTLSVARDLIKGPISQVLLAIQQHSLYRLLWNIHAAWWVLRRPLLAVRKRRHPRTVRLGSLRERPWGWGEAMPPTYLHPSSRPDHSAVPPPAAPETNTAS